MKKTIKGIKNFLVVVLSYIMCVHCGGAAGTGTTDPIDLPTPVSHLSVSSPSEDGLVRITSPAGFADAGTTVTITSGTSSSLIKRTSVSPRLENGSITADNDGAFQVELEGEINDSFTITYTTDGSETSGTQTVPDNQPPLPLDIELRDIGVDVTLGLAHVLAVDGTDAFVYIVSLSDGSITDTVEITGGSGATRISVDQRTGASAVIDPDSDVIYEIHSEFTSYDEVAVTNPQDIAAGEGGNFYMIAQAGSTNFSFYSVAMNIATGYTGVTSGALTVSQSILIDTSYGSIDEFAMVSEMSDGSYHLFGFEVADALLISQVADVEIAGIDSPSGLVLYDSGNQALITDSANDSIFHVDLATGDVTQITVGDEPLGIEVDEDNGVAYVTCSGDDSLNVVDLAAESVSTTVDLGLEPTQSALRTGSDLLSISLNTGDNTLSLID